MQQALCLHAHIVLSVPKTGLRRRREGRIRCPAPGCSSRPFSHQALAAHLPQESFDVKLSCKQCEYIYLHKCRRKLGVHSNILMSNKNHASQRRLNSLCSESCWTETTTVVPRYLRVTRLQEAWVSNPHSDLTDGNRSLTQTYAIMEVT